MTVYLHIGTGKTGTTTIQNFFASHRPQLKAQGFLYPQTLGATNHVLASVAVTDFHPGFTTRKHKSLTSAAQLPVFRAQLAKDLAKEVAESGCPNVIISNEHLFEKVRTVEQAAMIRDLVGFDADVKVILYIRRQDQFAASAFSEIIRMGFAGKLSEFMRQKRTNDLLDYYGGLKAWAEVFGDANVTLRVFERGRMVAGDALRDLASLMTLDIDAVLAERGEAAVDRRRDTLDASKTEFLRRFNRHVRTMIKPGEGPFPLEKFGEPIHRIRIINALEKLEAGDKFQLPHPEALGVLTGHEAANAEMFKRFGVEPFAGGLVEQPEKEGAGARRQDEFFQYFAAIWLSYHCEVIQLKAELDEARQNARLENV